MPIKILMPALSPTMTEGNLAKWLKNEGDTIKSGDVIAEIETDKATMEVEAVDEGTLGKILVPGGTEGVKVNEPIALLLEEGEDKSALEGAGARHRPPRPTARPRPRTGGSARRTQAGTAGAGGPQPRAGAAPIRRRRAHLGEPARAPHGGTGRARSEPPSPAAARTAGSSRPTSRRRCRRRARRRPEAEAAAAAAPPAAPAAAAGAGRRRSPAPPTRRSRSPTCAR